MQKYVLSPAAKSDLDEIWDFSAGQWGLAQAERYTNDIERSIKLIADMPGLGRAVSEAREGYFKFPAGSHMPIYRNLKSKIDIVRILHQGMDIDRHL